AVMERFRERLAGAPGRGIAGLPGRRIAGLPTLGIAGLPTLAERYSPAANGFGLIRLTLTVGVVIAHSQPIGFGWQPYGESLTRGQIEFGPLMLYGFFVLSGFLITGTALKGSWLRFLWRRVLRLMPGYWVSLLVTALGFAPLVAIIENGSLDGFWQHPQ